MTFHFYRLAVVCGMPCSAYEAAGAAPVSYRQPNHRTVVFGRDAGDRVVIATPVCVNKNYGQSVFTTGGPWSLPEHLLRTLLPLSE